MVKTLIKTTPTLTLTLTLTLTRTRTPTLTLTLPLTLPLRPELEIVHINEVLGGTETAAYLAKYDSVHGTWAHEIEPAGPKSIVVDGSTNISYSEEADFKNVDWAAMGVELVIDCTGKFLTSAALMPYIESCGVKRVVVSAPVKEP